MPASASLLNTATTAVKLTAEYAAFQTALAALSAAAEEDRQARWLGAYGDGQPGLSPAYRLRRACRDAVANAMASLSEALSPADEEAACQTLAASVAPDSTAPVTFAERTPSLSAEDVDILRVALEQLAGA